MTNLGMSVDFGFCSDSVGSVPYFLPDTTIKQSDSFWSELNQNLHLRLATPTSRACYEALVHPAMISHLSPKVSSKTLPQLCERIERQHVILNFHSELPSLAKTKMYYTRF